MKDKFCELCEAKGLKRKLKFCRVNFEEGILLCENDMCVYPFGATAVVDRLLWKSPATEEQGQGRQNQVKVAEKLSTTKISYTSNVPVSHFYWSNTDNLCWLDAVMTVLVNNRCLQLCLEKYQPRESILQQLYTDFIEAQKLGPKEQGKDMLHNVRMKVFEFLKTKMKCSLGVNDSALASLNVLLKESAVICKRFIQDCEWTFKCSSCGHTQVDRHKKLVVTFPNTTDDFCMPAGVFLRACYKCKVAGQRSQLDLKQLPPCVMAHFVEGVKNRDLLKTGFVCQGNEYVLCQLIQYEQNPDHFIAWIRNANGTHWAKVDDTQNGQCKWSKGLPSFPLDQVYLAVWERAKLYQGKSLAGEMATKKSAEVKRPFNSLQTAKPTATMSKLLPGNLKGEQLHCISSTTGKILYRENNGKQNRENIARVRCESVLPTNDCEKSSEAETEGVGQKRKNSFEPYIPKKKRSLTSSGEAVTSSTDFTLPIQPSSCVGSKSTVSSTTRSQWKAVSLIDKEKQGVVCDNQSDSGYSSPGSNSSCVSLPNQCTKEDNLILNEIIDTLDDLIELQRNADSDKKTSELHLKSSPASTRSNTDVVSALQSNLTNSQIQTKPNLVGLSDYISKTSIASCVQDRARDTISELDLRMKSGSPCDFADIETSNCGNDVIDELDSIHFYDSMDLSNDFETAAGSSDRSDSMVKTPSLIDSTIDSKVYSTPLRFPSREAEQSNTWIPTDNLCDLQTMNLEDFPNNGNSTSCVQNFVTFPENTKSLNGHNELVNDINKRGPVLYPEGHQELNETDPSVNCVSFNPNSSWFSSSELTCGFQPINLPEFIKHESSTETNSLVPSTDHISACVEDILEKIFPTKLLDSSSGDGRAVCELTTGKTDFCFEDDRAWDID